MRKRSGGITAHLSSDHVVSSDATDWNDQYAGIQQVPAEEMIDLHEDPYVEQYRRLPGH